MNDDSSFILTLAVITAIAAMLFMFIVHALSPKTDFTNQCIRHHGIPDTHVQEWKCIGSKDE